MNKEEQLTRLLRLKRHETPDTAYFENFVGEFHRYLQQPPPAPPGRLALVAAQAAGILAHLRRPSIAWAAAGACAGVLLLAVYGTGGNPSGPDSVAKGVPANAPSQSAADSQRPAEADHRLISIPSEQTLPVSSTPELVPPVPGKRRTADQPDTVFPQNSSPPTPPVRPAPAASQ